MRKLYPRHDIFNQHPPVDYSHLLPFYLHGDGRRTYKKDPILILSMFPACGDGTSKNTAELQPVKRPRLSASASSRPTEGCITYEPGVNMLGNSLTDRFLFTAMKAELYKDKRSRFTCLLDTWGKHLGQLFNEGFCFNGETWKVAVLGLTGDAPFLREAGNHIRSFSNVGKSATATRLKGVYWLCTAGKSGGPPFEDVRVTADWTKHCGPHNPLPWDTPGPLLAHLPVNEDDVASFYKPDMFHVMHAGVLKDFSASALIYICKSVCKQRNIQLSMAKINEQLQEFLQDNKGERLNFKRFTLDLLGYVSSRSFPFGHWNKNMDTATVCKFVQYLCEKNPAKVGEDSILESILDVCSAVGHFMHIVFSAAFFLTESEGWQMIQSGHAFLQSYVRLARKSHAARMCIFSLKPKLHYFAHIIFTALQQFQSDSGSVISPIAESTFMAEDFVGEISRLSRRVSEKQQGRKVLYRYMVAASNQLCNRE